MDEVGIGKGVFEGVGGGGEGDAGVFGGGADGRSGVEAA